ncbi:HEAT repeat protein-like protein [Venturia nashicola]|uniref:HEAT repeat protein-like protein n=1 Tax=Venturia nashicola TaxID=86259 RepID=A0A4Z1NV92_9PEZI|nr:HEAT repeat protein-like protein [Venturia nashicola]
MEARTRAFQILKPPCVKLSEVALKFMGKAGNAKEILTKLDDLHQALLIVSARKEVLNDKLAEYVFFPLSAVLKQLEKIPVRAEERTLECLLILLSTAWEDQLSPELGIQLLILFSFIADQKGARSSEELQILTFKCLASLLSSLSNDNDGRNALLKTAIMPHLGKTVSVILDAVADAPSDTVRISAISALQSFCDAVSDHEALAISFLPGIMSSMAKVLTLKSANVSSKAISSSLHVLANLLPRIFSDVITKKFPEKAEGTISADTGKRLDSVWLRATAPQVKMALANIIKLQQHDRENVRQELARLSTLLLRECKIALSDSMSMLLETLVTLADDNEPITGTLKALLDDDHEFSDILRSSLHYWIISLPRIMESTDESKKQRRIHQIKVTFNMLNEIGVDMTMIDRDMAVSLRDSVVNAINDKKQTHRIVDYGPGPQSTDLTKFQASKSTTFNSVLTVRKSQMDNIKEISQFIEKLSLNDSSLKIAQELVDSIYGASHNVQLANFWVALNILRNSYESTLSIDDLLDLGGNQGLSKEDLLEQLYDFSISTLTEQSTAAEQDWRLQALALETLALQASRQKANFRTELIEALYPVLHLIGSPVPQLRDHAIATVNLFARECDYKDSSELIVANVDYLVNAISLRLNTFDISPQAPQVLLMMVKLSGPPLLPYLDDLVDSMFAALESFHGYPKLVEILFAVLRVIVEEGSKAPQLAVTDGKDTAPHLKGPLTPILNAELVTYVKNIRERYENEREEEDAPLPVPQRPWKESNGEHEESKDKAGSEEEEDDQERERQVAAKNEEEKIPPAPRTYSLLLNISRLTQHYLTSSSAELRTSLLSLLNTTFPALAKHENSFLPLINSLWPVLLPRLDDSEAYVVSGTLDVLNAMCVNAGDFMSGRIDEAWSHIKRLHRLKTGKASKRVAEGVPIDSTGTMISNIVCVSGREVVTTGQQHYIDAPSRIIWESLVRLLSTIVRYVAVSDNIFDDILYIVSPILESQPEIREAMSTRNHDAVWLALWRAEALMSKETINNYFTRKQVLSKCFPNRRFAEVE